MAALEIDACGQDYAHFCAGFTAHGDDTGEREAAQINDVAAQAPRAGYRIDLDLAAHRADCNAAHVEPGLDLDAQRHLSRAHRRADRLAWRAEQALRRHRGRTSKSQRKCKDQAQFHSGNNRRAMVNPA